MIDIEKLKQAALAANQGEWRIGALESYHGHNGQPRRFFYRNENDNQHTRCCVNGGEGDNGETFDSDADALFIATANPSAVLELITRLTQQEEQIASLVATNSLLDAEWREVTADKFAEMAEAIRLKDAALDWCIGEFNLRLDDIDLSQETIRVLSARHTQPSPDILQARDDRVAAACAQYVYAMGGTKGSVLLAEAMSSGEWRKYL